MFLNDFEWVQLEIVNLQTFLQKEFLISAHADGGPRSPSVQAGQCHFPPIDMSGTPGQLLKIPPFVRPNVA